MRGALCDERTRSRLNDIGGSADWSAARVPGGATAEYEPAPEN